MNTALNHRLLNRSSERPVRLRWRGFGSIEDLAECLERRQSVAIALPWGFHHVLCARLSQRHSANGSLHVRGDRALLSALATIPGLHDFADLADSADASVIEVRVSSPPPCVSIMFK